jgi:hypothetical protein
MKDLLKRASAEIRSLRRQNEILEAQMGVVEVFAAALGLKRENRGMGIDVAWELEREADKLPPEIHAINAQQAQQDRGA